MTALQGNLAGQMAGRCDVHYTYAEVYERYGLSCYICRGPIDPSVTDRGFWHPSLDHVVPICRGGQDTLENVRPAHNGCNSHKGCRLPHELAA